MPAFPVSGGQSHRRPQSYLTSPTTPLPFLINQRIVRNIMNTWKDDKNMPVVKQKGREERKMKSPRKMLVVGTALFILLCLEWTFSAARQKIPTWFRHDGESRSGWEPGFDWDSVSIVDFLTFLPCINDCIDIGPNVSSGKEQYIQEGFCCVIRVRSHWKLGALAYWIIFLRNYIFHISFGKHYSSKSSHRRFCLDARCLVDSPLDKRDRKSRVSPLF
jgi:hypothetical protein